VTLLEGPVWVVGALAGLALSGRERRRRATVLAVTAAGLGMLDDLTGSTSSKGLRGHLAALGRGEVTTGAVKLLGLAATGLAAAAAVDHGRVEPGRRPARRLVRTVVAGGVIAGTANLVNLLDLRPGRALKGVIALAAPMALPSPTAAAAVGASLGVLADDLDARSMLGDTGANTAGALVGLVLVERTGPLGRSVILAALTALTLASERVSFSAVIDRQPLLRQLDQWGRPATDAAR
jgi:UDP-N-acetylmuramyl pentapeptide phosphotransferase/UDP-N-acetylglucosamine-1-phosphate transferase